jgi:hypothetical protein
LIGHDQVGQRSQVARTAEIWIEPGKSCCRHCRSGGGGARRRTPGRAGRRR